jgi:hypothetical protein
MGGGPAKTGWHPGCNWLISVPPDRKASVTSTVIPLSRIAKTRPVPTAGCGTSAGQGDLPAAVWNRIKDHPCYSEEAHHYFARMQ